MHKRVHEALQLTSFKQSHLQIGLLTGLLVFSLSACIQDIATEDQVAEHLKTLADSGPVADGDGAKDTSKVSDSGRAADGGLVGAQCLTKGDCAGKVLGLTPCRVADCVQGVCALVKRPIDIVCVPDENAEAACVVFRCDAAAACVAAPDKDGTKCGFFSCGKQCLAGKCVDSPQSVYDDGNPCTIDYCDNGQQVRHDPLTDLTLSCDDGDPCTKKGYCDKGLCVGSPVDCSDGVSCTNDSCVKGQGCTHTPDDASCDDGDPCSLNGCDPKAGCAVTGAAAVTATCNDGNTCTKDDHCDGKGACTGSSSCSCQTAADCITANLCLGALKCEAGSCVLNSAAVVSCPSLGETCGVNLCNPNTGKCEIVPKQEGKVCSDDDACTTDTTCTKGSCSSGKLIDCDDKNICTKDACYVSGGCSYSALDGVSCDDGSPCTSGDGCSKGGCVGAPKQCDDSVACTVDACDPKTGKCSSVPAQQTCDDGNPCTSDTCVLGSGCVHQPVKSGEKCKDGDACTTWSCAAGQCKSVFTCECQKDGDCGDGNACTKDSCVAGKCANDAVPTVAQVSCDSGDKCQVAGSGICDAGSCKAGNKPKDCSGIDKVCRKGVCDPKTGQCGLATKADGTGCDADGSGCTVKDFCKAGTCQKGAPPDCTGKDAACVTGVCKSTAPSSFSCEAQPKLKGVPCSDGKYCTVDDVCDGNGACSLTTPRSCPGGVCAVGSCDESSGSCKQALAADGAACADGSKCTAGEYCKGGVCVASASKVCPADGACTVGSCIAATGACVVKSTNNGKVCDDGSSCTSGDACDGAGGCVGTPAKTCVAPGPCYLASCNAKAGKCAFKPMQTGATCDDGNACTEKDACNASGQCFGSRIGGKACECKHPEDCKDGNPCTKDHCDKKKKKCTNKATPGAWCADGDPCTTESKCNANKCVGKKFKLCADGGACVANACQNIEGKATCVAASKPKGTGCNGGACASTSACDGLGACKATALKCDDGDPCTTDTCAPDGTCSYGKLDCDDAKPCTVDSCDATVGCVNKPTVGTSCF